MMHGHGKSDSVIVAVKPTNKCGAIRCGAGGAKDGDQGECGSAKHAPGAEPGKRVTGAGAHTASSKGKEEGEVHRAPPPHQHRSARRGVLRTQGERRTGGRWTDVDGLRGRPRAQPRGPARSGPSGSVSGTAVTARLHTQAGRPTAPARDCRSGGQDRPTGDSRGAQRDLRGRLPRVLVRVPTRARHARCAGCAQCRDRQHEGELDTGRRHPIVLRRNQSGMAGSLSWNIGSATDASSA